MILETVSGLLVVETKQMFSYSLCQRTIFELDLHGVSHKYGPCVSVGVLGLFVAQCTVLTVCMVLCVHLNFCSFGGFFAHASASFLSNR